MTEHVLTRLDDWEIRLARHVQDAMARPFAWGETDCLMLVADGIAAVTGTDIRPPRLRYSTPSGALSALKRRGFETPLDALDSVLPRVPAALARRGDVAAVIRDGDVTCGTVCGRAILAPTETLPVLLPVSPAMPAWRVGW